MSPSEILATFTLKNIPSLDVAVLGALQLYEKESLPIISKEDKKRLVLGSGNAAKVATLLFDHNKTVFANENNFLKYMTYNSDAEEVVILSASGGKHAITMVQAALERGFKTQLMTNNPEAPAGKFLDDEDILLFPKNREPYTYNTSTYLGFIFAVTKESPVEITSYLENNLANKILRNLSDYRAFTFILSDHHAPLADMIKTKFDELFGPMLVGRAFTESEIMHAKTVVQSGEELFISLNVENNYYGVQKNRLNYSVPESGMAAMMAVSYYLIGQIQKSQPPYFGQNIDRYCKTASDIFGYPIEPIVE